MHPAKTSRFSPDSPTWRLVAIGLTCAAVAAIVSTYHVFNNMYDEPAHLAAGMEWLSRGTYTYEPQHPPLSRVASALGPWLVGERGTGQQLMYNEGRAILGVGEHYRRTLALARLGQLPFFLVLVFTTWTWTRRIANERAAALAVFFVVANPNVLAHAGVAGTDNGPAALMPAALLAWALWLLQPTLVRRVAGKEQEKPNYALSAWLGALVALAGLTKFNAIAFWLPAATGVALYTVFTARRDLLMTGGLELARPLGVAVATAAFVTWAMYRFSVGKVGTITVPAPEFFEGLKAFFRHGTGGHPAYLLGHVRLGGWWYYDVVVVLVKTPLPLLIPGALGTYLVVRTARKSRPKPVVIGDATFVTIHGGTAAANVLSLAPVFGIASVLLVASATPVDIGVRLLLAIYPMLAVLCAIGFSWAWERARNASTRFAVGALLAWSLLEPATTHPDYIAYFNQAAGREPEKILVDSNLDWGQDLYRLRDVSNELRVDSLRVHYFGTASFAAVGLERARRLRPNERTTGWVAASETFYAGVWADSALNWLHAYSPYIRVGHSIRLYYIKP